MPPTSPASPSKDFRTRLRASKLATVTVLGFLVLALGAALIVGNGTSAPQAAPRPASTPGASSSRSSDSRDSGAEQAYPMPDFALASLEGAEVSADSLKGTPTWLVFSETWCSPCTMQMPDMQAAAEKYGPDKLQVVAVFIGEDRRTVADFIEDNGYTFTSLLDSATSVASRFGVMGTPTNFFADSDGNLLYGAPGMLTSEAIDQALTAITE